MEKAKSNLELEDEDGGQQADAIKALIEKQFAIVGQLDHAVKAMEGMQARIGSLEFRLVQFELHHAHLFGVEEKTPRQEVQTACEITIKAIQTLPPSQWMQWIQYILEGLDSEGGGYNYDTELEALGTGIDARLMCGRW